MSVLSPKFLLIAFILVLMMGLGYLGFIYYLAHYKAENKIVVNPLPQTKNPVSLTLILSNPDDNSLTFTPDLLLSGKTSPQAVIILSSNDEDQVLEPSQGGDFSATLKLESGINQVLVKVFDSQGNSKTEERTVYYSTEKI